MQSHSWSPGPPQPALVGGGEASSAGARGLGSPASHMGSPAPTASRVEVH